MATSNTVRSDRNDEIVTIIIDRPQVRNAVDRPTAEALANAFLEFERDDKLLAAVLCGEGGTFCAGADLKGVAEGRGNRIVEPSMPFNPLAPTAPMGPTRMRLSKPVIAAVSGHAVAGGLELALWCDLRVVEENAVFGVFCRRWGVPLIDGGTIRLPRLIGHSHAMDLILTGRGVSGDEAKAMGLANRLTEPGKALDGAFELAQSLSRFPQKCLRSDRVSSYRQWSLDLDAALREETWLGREVIRSGETQQGASRFASGAGRHGDFSKI